MKKAEYLKLSAFNAWSYSLTRSHTQAVYDRRSGTRRPGRKSIQPIADGLPRPVPTAASANTDAEVHDGSPPPAAHTETLRLKNKLEEMIKEMIKK